jgi:uncharacterized protein (TIRG00374 family)
VSEALAIIRQPLSGHFQLFKAIRILVSGSLVFVLFFFVGWGQFFQSLRELNFSLGLATTICLTGLFALGGLNPWLLLRALHPVPFCRFMVAFIHGYAVGLILPGQLGDASLTLFLQKSGVPIHKSGSAYLIDKVTTLSLFLLVAGYGLHLLSIDIRVKWILTFLSIFALLSVLVYFILWRTPSKSKLAGLVNNGLGAVIEAMRVFADRWHLLLMNFGVTLLKWLLMSLCYSLAFRSFGVTVDWPFAAIIPVLSTLSGYIPVSAGGIGVVEWSAVYWFSLIGIEKQDVLCVYVFLRAMQYLIAGFLLLLSSIPSIIDNFNIDNAIK